MFWHAFSYRFKTLLQKRSFLFWTLIFPLVLASFYHFAFGQLNQNYQEFVPIKTAVIEGNGVIAADVFNLTGANGLLEVITVSESEGLELLASGMVSGLVFLGEELELVIKAEGPNQAILKALLSDYGQLAFEQDFTEQVYFSKAYPNSTLSLFYALVAMACMYGSYWGINNATDLQANLSPRGARRSVAPTSKLSLVFSDILAALVLSFFEVLILLAFLSFFLNVDFGNHPHLTVLIALISSWAGVSVGSFVGTVVKGDGRFKSRVLLLVNNLTSIAAGLISINLRDTILFKFPLLARLNPAGLIADSFYTLYSHGRTGRLFLNLLCLALIALVLSLASFVYLRREKYASL